LTNPKRYAIIITITLIDLVLVGGELRFLKIDYSLDKIYIYLIAENKASRGVVLI